MARREREGVKWHAQSAAGAIPAHLAEADHKDILNTNILTFHMAKEYPLPYGMSCQYVSVNIP